MFSMNLRYPLKWALAALTTLVLTAGNASAAVVLNFIELANDAGIQLTGVNANGSLINVTKLNSETFGISSPAVPNGYVPDAIVSRIGVSRTSQGFLVNILESVGGPLSDQVWVHVLGGAFTVIDFISDPAQFVTGVTPFATVVETGALQNVLTYNNDRGETVTINVLSNLDVPEPASLALVGAALLGIVATRKRRAARAAV